MLSPVMMVSLMRTFQTVAVDLVYVILAFDFPHLCLLLLPFLWFRYSYLLNGVQFIDLSYHGPYLF